MANNRGISGKKITYRGKEFKSMSALARHLGYHPSSLIRTVERYGGADHLERKEPETREDYTKNKPYWPQPQSYLGWGGTVPMGEPLK